MAKEVTDTTYERRTKNVSVFKEQVEEPKAEEPKVKEESVEDILAQIEAEQKTEDDLVAREKEDSFEVTKEDLKTNEEIQKAMYEDDADEEKLNTSEAKMINKVLKQSAMSEEYDEISILTKKNKRIIELTPAQRREIYSDGGIIPLGATLNFKTEGQQRKEDFLDLVQSLQKQEPIFNCSVYAVAVFKNKLYAKASYRSFDIYIPYDQLLPAKELSIINDMKDEEREKHLRRAMDKRIGSKIDFIATQIDEGKCIAAGSRIKAMEYIQRAWYLTKDVGGKRWKLAKNTKCEARIVATTKTQLTVEVYGMEFKLRSDEISYVNIINVGRSYPTGSTVAVKFTKLDRIPTQSGGLAISATVSIKEAISDFRASAYGKYHVGDKVKGIVTSQSRYGIYVRAGATSIYDTTHIVEILCSFPTTIDATGVRTELPTTGDEVLVSIREKGEIQVDGTENPYRLYGSIIMNFSQKEKTF